ncbi:MAG TPA: alpha-ketoglutarate-dependent dioxygenase AlkB [Phototrophicaceae bacterium]|nr:alpha-ketoglutarate-dependent dioxygenase AlkB [Phototrophicaceae bacterium]
MDAIAGLTLISNYLSADEQTQLLAIVDQGVWLTDLKRRVQHFGYVYNYKKRQLDPSMYLGALPDWAQSLAERLHADGFAPALPDQVIVNEYQPGQGIAPHVDCVPCFADTILSISLGSPCVMDYTPLKREAEVRHVLLQPGSLLIMRGEARYEWKHGIAARKRDLFEGQVIERQRRVSLTLRKVID